jgi:hypothetical protein
VNHGLIILSLAVATLATHASYGQSRRDRFRDRDRGGDRNGSVERSMPSTQATTQASAPGSAGRMEDQFKVLLERSIFARSGIARSVERPATTSTAPSAPQLTPEQAVVFVGVLAQDNEYVAFAENQVTRQLMVLRTGDDVARGRVVEITLDTIAYGSGGQIKVVHLGQNLAGELAPTSSFAGSVTTTAPSGTPGGTSSGPLSAVEERLRQRRLRGE